MGAAKPKRQVREVDLKKFSEPIVYLDDSRGVHLPADVPFHMRVFRLMAEEDNPNNRGTKVLGLKGWTVQLDAFTFGVSFYFRVGRDGTLRLFCEDESGREKLVEWKK